MNSKEALLTRRNALKGAASLIGGTLAAAQLGGFLSRAAQAAADERAPLFFDTDQFALLERAVDIVGHGALGLGAAEQSKPHGASLL